MAPPRCAIRVFPSLTSTTMVCVLIITIFIGRIRVLLSPPSERAFVPLANDVTTTAISTTTTAIPTTTQRNTPPSPTERSTEEIHITHVFSTYTTKSRATMQEMKIVQDSWTDSAARAKKDSRLNVEFLDFTLPEDASSTPRFARQINLTHSLNDVFKGRIPIVGEPFKLALKHARGRVMIVTNADIGTTATFYERVWRWATQDYTSPEAQLRALEAATRYLTLCLSWRGPNPTKGRLWHERLCAEDVKHVFTHNGGLLASYARHSAREIAMGTCRSLVKNLPAGEFTVNHARLILSLMEGKEISTAIFPPAPREVVKRKSSSEEEENGNDDDGTPSPTPVSQDDVDLMKAIESFIPRPDPDLSPEKDRPSYFAGTITRLDVKTAGSVTPTIPPIILPRDRKSHSTSSSTINDETKVTEEGGEGLLVDNETGEEEELVETHDFHFFRKRIEKYGVTHPGNDVFVVSPPGAVPLAVQRMAHPQGVRPFGIWIANAFVHLAARAPTSAAGNSNEIAEWRRISGTPYDPYTFHVGVGLWRGRAIPWMQRAESNPEFTLFLAANWDRTSGGLLRRMIERQPGVCRVTTEGWRHAAYCQVGKDPSRCVGIVRHGCSQYLQLALRDVVWYRNACVNLARRGQIAESGESDKRKAARMPQPECGFCTFLFKRERIMGFIPEGGPRPALVCEEATPRKFCSNLNVTESCS